MLLAGAGAVAVPRRPDFFDGQTIYVDGAEIVLTDIIAPSPATLLGRAEPGAEIASSALREFLATSRQLSFYEPPRDRWGRLSGPARFVRENAGHKTLQAALLEAGAARVSPQTEDHATLDHYFEAEDAARASRKGIWSLSAYAILDTLEQRRLFSFQIFRGAVRSASENRGRVYFNFGDDFRTDLTATVTQGAFRRWRREASFASYAGRIVELRGVVDWINGPSIELRHERQMRLL
jgi:endonuclease YncB( thermonuclease family)